MTKYWLFTSPEVMTGGSQEGYDPPEYARQVFLVRASSRTRAAWSTVSYVRRFGDPWFYDDEYPLSGCSINRYEPSTEEIESFRSDGTLVES